MIKRSLFKIAFSAQWGRQMRFITGPRQAGKTTLAREKLALELCEPMYYLWDRQDVRARHRANELFFTQDRPPRPEIPWVCFDEIHKIRRWKTTLKAMFDSVGDSYRFMITGSAKFDVVKRAGDSLAGRFFTFHLSPLALREVEGRAEVTVPPDPTVFMEDRLSAPDCPEGLTALLAGTGFPEPFLSQSVDFRRKWADDYLDSVVREDIGALTRILDRDAVADLYRLLPEMSGSPLSLSSLASHLEVSPHTIKSYLKRLEDFYLAFRLFPYAKNVKRALIKTPKVYLYDWTRVEDEGKRFENYMAVELFGLCRLWTDATGKKHELFYVRTREGHETNFLMLRDRNPFMLFEAKLSDGSVDAHHLRTQAQLGGIPFLQICRQSGVAALGGRAIARLSASRFFA